MEEKDIIKKLTIQECCDTLLPHLRVNFPEEVFQEIFDVSINLDYVRKNPEIAETFATFENSPIDKLECERIVLESKNPKINYLFARNVKGADIKAHEQVVLESKDAWINYLFADDIKGADIKSHEQVILENKNPEYNYRFAAYVEGANIKAHEQVVLESKDAKYSYEFAQYFPDVADIKSHGIVIINSGSKKYMKKFADILIERISHAQEVNELSSVIEYADMLREIQQALKTQKVLSRKPNPKN